MTPLPEFCFIPHPEKPLWIAKIERGVEGYTPIDSMEDPDALNVALHITPAQVAAMRYGSMFGFHGVFADPDTYDANGQPRREVIRARVRHRWS
jgi:hypothetical protein